MNSVNLIGRPVKDPEVRVTGDQLPVASFTIAVDKMVGGEKKADFIKVIAFGKTAEMLEKYSKKGLMIGVSGRIQTGRYTNKDGVDVYTTDVVAERVTMIQWPEKADGEALPEGMTYATVDEDDIPF